MNLEEAGFSFQPIGEYAIRIGDRKAMMHDQRKGGKTAISIWLFGESISRDDLDQQELLDLLITNFLEAWEGTYVKGPISPVEVDGCEGIAVEILLRALNR